jgi:hypothetical protein
LVAANTYGSIYVSKNSGASWTPASLPYPIKGWYVACSSDGTKMAAAGSGFICTSTNSGTTWVQQNGSAQGAWSGITSSADGKTLAAATVSMKLIQKEA